MLLPIYACVYIASLCPGDDCMGAGFGVNRGIFRGIVWALMGLCDRLGKGRTFGRSRGGGSGR